MRRLKLIIIYIVVVIIILLPDMIMELFHMVLEALTETGHTLFEIVEVILDKLVEHTFHTDLHQTQIIVFYIIFIFAAFWIRRAYRAWPVFYTNCKQKIRSTKAAQKTKLIVFWQELSWFQKISYIAIPLTLLLTYLFFL